MVIGLTGGIGCGKSLAAGFFAQEGFAVVDADQLAREVLNRPATCALLQERWGREALTPEGLPNRAWIAAKVFADERERTFLESITHPEVSRLRAAAIADSSRDFVVEIPLLFEKNLGADFKAVVCVACSESVQVQRLVAKGFKESDARHRINAQLPISEKVKRADYVLWNDGATDFLRQQVQRLVKQLRTAP